MKEPPFLLIGVLKLIRDHQRPSGLHNLGDWPRCFQQSEYTGDEVVVCQLGLGLVLFNKSAAGLTCQRRSAFNSHKCSKGAQKPECETVKGENLNGVCDAGQHSSRTTPDLCDGGSGEGYEENSVTGYRPIPVAVIGEFPPSRPECGCRFPNTGTTQYKRRGLSLIRDILLSWDQIIERDSTHRVANRSDNVHSWTMASWAIAPRSPLRHEERP